MKLFGQMLPPCLSAIFFLSLLTSCTFADDDRQPPTISVSGTAEIKVQPDRAVLTFSIQSRKATLDDAVADNDQAIDRVMKLLESESIEQKYIQTDIVKLQPIHKSQPPSKNRPFLAPAQANNAPQVNRNPIDEIEGKLNPIGYEAHRGISVTVTDLAKLEKIYTGLLKQGVNCVAGISFECSQLRKHRDQARLDAIRAARQKATALAGALGIKLSGVQKIEESSWHPVSNFNQISTSFEPARVTSSSGISGGTISVSASVSVVFLLGEHKF